MKSPVVLFKNVWKSYPSYNSVNGGFKYFLLHLPQALRELRMRHNVLEGISLEINKGERFGFIGRNGVGKSTTLGLIAGVLSANRGSVQVRGRVSPLLELGAGFHPQLTGRENIFLNGILMGLTRQEVASKLEDIIEFSGLREFIDQPIRTYSSGMHVKLGFAVASQLNPEILLLDEVFSVGDIAFQDKCRAVFEDFKKNKNITIIIVSHDIEAIRSMCDRVAWIEDKKIRMIGDAKKVVAAYLKHVTFHKIRQTALPLHLGFGHETLCAEQACAGFDITTSQDSMKVRLALWQRGAERPLQYWSHVPQSVSLKYENATFVVRDAQGDVLTPQLDKVIYDNKATAPLLISAQCEEQGRVEGSPAWLLYMPTEHAAETYKKEAQCFWEKKAGEGLPPFLWASGRVIHFVVRNIGTDDVVSLCVLQMVATLHKYAIPCRVYAYTYCPELAGYVSPIADVWNALQTEDTLFYHYATEDSFLPELAACYCKTKILYYHDVALAQDACTNTADSANTVYTHFSAFNFAMSHSEQALQNILPYLAATTPTCVFPPNNA